ncbi:MAG TPA: hypothetical protein VFZ73_06970 [Gemmatimonadaceae bacterium]
MAKGKRNERFVRRYNGVTQRFIFRAVLHNPYPGLMAKRQVRRPREVAPPTPFEEARDEMFQHIMQCGVIGCEPEDQAQWFDDTMKYLADRFSELTQKELGQIRVLGERFVQPPKASPAPVASAV